MDTEEKLDLILTHIQNVQANCIKLGKKFIRLGDKENIQLGVKLIQNGMKHDNSKFGGMEFAHLFPNSILLDAAIDNHNTTNKHHPEYWGSIHKMPDVYLAEMVCDSCGRGGEMGTDIREYFSKKATARFGFNMNDEIGRKITYYLDMLLMPTFKTVVKS